MKIYLLLSLFLPVFLFAQKETDDVRAGNRLYNNKKYTEAEIEYRKALQKNSQSFAANYNLGNSLFRQGKYNEALEQFKLAAPMAADDKPKIAAGFHNMGNTLMAGNQLQDAIAAYKAALKSNPSDNETRYNLAYAQSLLKKQQQENQNDKKKQDQKNDPNKPDKENAPNKQQPKEKPEQQQPEQQLPQMSKENAQQILNALEQDEKNTQDDAKRVQARSGKRMEKDW